jgi:integrase
MRKKRGQNHGSEYQRRSDERWVAQVTIQKKHRMKYFYSQCEAEAWLKQSILKISQVVPLEGSRMSVAVFLTSWLAIISLAVKPRTWVQYDQVVNKHILPYLGHLSIQELRSDQVQSFYQRKQQDGTGARTLSLINCILHNALDYAVSNGFILHNPVHGTMISRPKYHEQKVLNLDQVRVFLQSCQGTRWEALFCLAITTGMREGEILGLKWSDIRWDTGQLQIQRQLQRIPRQGLVFSEPKTIASRRNLAIGEEMLTKLRAHANLQEYERCLAGERWRENGLVFPSDKGTPMDPHRIFDQYKQLLKQANLPDIRFHDLRYTHATLMLGWGIHPKVVQERLGHAQISHTLGIYSHVLPILQTEAARKMDEMVLQGLKEQNG